VPAGDRDDVVAEALLDLCVGVRNAHGRGVAAVDCRYNARHGLAATRTRRGRPPRLLGDLYEDPEGALAAGGPSPVEEAEAREALQGLLGRLPERLRRVVCLRAEGYTQAEVAVRLGCSRQRVQQLLLEARRLICLGRDG
jgi:RNA polymerase sigma factor (sigma-70 family)